jgi:hypothetical protein
MVPPVKRIEFDIADAATASNYPRHGWAENGDGVRLLWLPTMHVFRRVDDVRKAKGLTTSLSAADSHAVAAFYYCLHNLVVALREMAQLMREDDAFTIDSDQKLAKRYKTDELCRLYLDTVFVQLRRLADRFAAASRVVLFAKHGSVSTQFKKLRDNVLDTDFLKRMEPTVDVIALQGAFREHTHWFNELRNNRDREGIRDQMEHRSIEVLIGGQRKNEEPVVRTAYLTRPCGGIDAERELFRILKVILSDMCEFLTSIHMSIDFGKTYGRYDNFLVFGMDIDIVEWWPRL